MTQQSMPASPRRFSASGRAGEVSKCLRLTLCLLLSVLSLGLARAAEPRCPSCEVSDDKEAQYNRLLNLTPAQQKTATNKHVLYGLPRPPANATREHLLIQKDYLTWYDDDLLVPLWVGYKLTRANITRLQDRVECFRPDPRLPAAVTALCTDYLEPTYDQGHLAPNADFKGTEAMMINTYLYSNMTPQHDTFNRHTWERLESLVRMWVQKRGDLFVITGSVFDRNGDRQRDADHAAARMAPSNHVAIPTHFYKIVMQKKTLSANDTIAILLPHDDAKHTGDAWVRYVTTNITTIGEIERITGIDFLPGLNGTKRTAAANFRAPALWPQGVNE
jgi:endonuclease G, mitochondrial